MDNNHASQAEIDLIDFYTLHQNYLNQLYFIISQIYIANKYKNHHDLDNSINIAMYLIDNFLQDTENMVKLP